LCFTPDGKKLLAGFAVSSENRDLYCWDLITRRQLWESKDFYILTRVPAFTPEGILLSTSPPLDVAAGKAARVENLPRIPLGGPHLAVTRDGQMLLVSSAEGVAVWDLKSGTQKRLLSGAGDEMVLAPDGNTLITNNGCLQRWDLASGKQLYADNFNDGHIDEVVNLVFSADGKRMASAAVDGSVRFWDVTTGRPIHVWRAHEARRQLPGQPTGKDGVNALDMTPDGRWIISAGSEKHLRLWDSSTGKEAGTFSIPNSGAEIRGEHVFRLRISEDGTKAVGLFGTEYFQWSEKKGELAGHNHWLANWDLPKGRLFPSFSKLRMLLRSTCLLTEEVAECLFLGQSAFSDVEHHPEFVAQKLFEFGKPGLVEVEDRRHDCTHVQGFGEEGSGKVLLDPLNRGVAFESVPVRILIVEVADSIH
jgi:WD40 repeat protein